MVTHQEITKETAVAQATKNQNPIFATSSVPAKRPIHTSRRRNAGVRRRLAFRRAFKESITLHQQAGAQALFKIEVNAEEDKFIATSSLPAVHVVVGGVSKRPLGPLL